MNEDHNHSAECTGVVSTGPIVLSESAKIDPIQDMDLHAVMAYIESLCKKARRGNAESAREVFWIATKATSQLEAIVEQHPNILHGVPLTDAPAIVGKTGIQSQKDITALATKFGLKPERKMRKDANAKIRKMVEVIAAVLNEQRRKGADDNLSVSAVPLSEILSDDGWMPGVNGPLWKGWKRAATFLPAPSRANAHSWWSVAEALLQKRYPTEGGKWFQHPKILKLVGKSKRAGEIDTDEARGTVKKGFRDRFFEAVERLSALTP